MLISTKSVIEGKENTEMLSPVLDLFERFNI